MINPVIRAEVDQTVALEWLRHSLREGEVEVISSAVLKVVEERRGRAYTLVSEAVDPTRLTRPSDGGVLESGAGPSRDAALAQAIETLADRGAACVVVEDELSLKRHPKPSLDGLLLTTFVGEQVLHWAELTDGTEAAITALHRGSGGYPTNAFVTSTSAQELRLVNGGDLDHDIAGLVAGSLVAVIVAAYDDETFLIWEPS
jgi:hypothetical protein